MESFLSNSVNMKAVIWRKLKMAKCPKCGTEVAKAKEDMENGRSSR